MKDLKILEDDCDFIGSIEDNLPQALNALREKDWELFFGGHEELACDENYPEPIQQIRPGSWVHTTAEWQAAMDCASQKRTRHWRRVPVREETLGKVSRFSATLCVVIHTSEGNSCNSSPVAPAAYPCLSPWAIAADAGSGADT
jgi:hypothetical protein